MDHEYYMKIALAEAGKAQKLGEVPIGAVLEDSGGIVAKDFNLKETLRSPIEHAEIRVIRQASRKLRTWRLVDSTLYVTLEPCPMCAGAILNSRIKRLVFGAYDPKGGAAGTAINLLETDSFNHRVEVIGGIMERECRKLLQDFFNKLR